MHSQRLSSLIGFILSLLGCALVIYGVFFLPMFFGNAGNTANSANVPNFEVDLLAPLDLAVVVALLLTYPLLCVLFVLATSVVSFFRVLSHGMLTWRVIAAITGLMIQGLVGFFAATVWSFRLPPRLGAGYWLTLLGFVVISVSIFLNTPRSAWR